jgi:hypothetical protein
MKRYSLVLALVALAAVSCGKSNSNSAPASSTPQSPTVQQPTQEATTSIDLAGVYSGSNTQTVTIDKKQVEKEFQVVMQLTRTSSPGTYNGLLRLSVDGATMAYRGEAIMESSTMLEVLLDATWSDSSGIYLEIENPTFDNDQIVGDLIEKKLSDSEYRWDFGHFTLNRK